MSHEKTAIRPSILDRIHLTLRGLAHCLEGYLATLRSVAPRP